MKKVVMLVLAVLLFVPTIASALDLEIGTRLNFSKVVHDDRFAKKGEAGKGFVGSMNHWDPEGPALPGDLFTRVALDSIWSAEASYRRLRVVGENVYADNLSRDGVFVFEGPELAVIGRLENKTRWTPYLGAGASYNFARFEEDGWWAEGFSSQEDFEANGPKSANGKTRRMSARNAIGLSAFVGTDVRLWKQLYADLRVGYRKLATEVSFKGFQNGVETYSRGPYRNIQFDTWDAGIGLKWKFKL